MTTDPPPPSGPDASGDDATSFAADDSFGLEALWKLVEHGVAESLPDPLLGMTIGEVTLTRLIAEGGMGRVYEGLPHWMSLKDGGFAVDGEVHTPSLAEKGYLGADGRAAPSILLAPSARGHHEAWPEDGGHRQGASHCVDWRRT